MPASDDLSSAFADGFHSTPPSASSPILPALAPSKKKKKAAKKALRAQGTAESEALPSTVKAEHATVIPDAVALDVPELVPNDLLVEEIPPLLEDLDLSPQPAVLETSTNIRAHDLDSKGDGIVPSINQKEAAKPDEDYLTSIVEESPTTFTEDPVYDVKLSPALAPLTARPQAAQINNTRQPPVGSNKHIPGSSPCHSRISQPATKLQSPPQSLLQPHFLSSIQNQNFYGSLKSSTNASAKVHSHDTCYRFDSFADSGDAISASKVKDALLVGGNGCLDVYRVLANKMEVVGRLEGLSGVVVDAKLIPAVLGASLEDVQPPLVALVIHTASMSADNAVKPNTSDIKLQATVQVFSLRTQALVATLFTSLLAVVPQSMSPASTNVPDILGGLRLQASGQYLTISSSVSGEIYTFHHSINENEEHNFRSIAKFWTSLQSSKVVDESRLIMGSDTAEEQKRSRELPLLALGDRWLVISCPASSSKMSIQGTVLTADSFVPFGVGSHNPPVQPATTAETTSTNAEGAVSRFTRQAAQEVLKASRKGIELGLAGWREFTSPAHPERQSALARPDADDPTFPPTHAPPETTQRQEQEPAVLSVIDLDKFAALSASSPRPPLPFAATFAIEDGCNFMSMSTDGLSLLTANRTGEVSIVWDLSHAFYSSASMTQGHDDIFVDGPTIRCVYRMQRNSPCVVTDAIWSQSDSELAIRTANGTTHLHFLPTNRRRGAHSETSAIESRQRSTSKSSVSHNISPASSPPAGYGVLDSLRNGWQSVSTQVSAIRSTSVTQPFDISSTFAGLRASGGRVLAKSIASGYSAAKTGVGDIWHADDNKIRNAEISGSTSMRWIHTADSLCLGLVQDGVLALYIILKIARMRGKSEFIGLKVEKGSRMEFMLPSTNTASTADLCSQQGPHGFWSLRPLPSTSARQTHQWKSNVDNMEDDVITNPDFCPFHVNPRVSMMVYSAAAEAQQQQQAQQAENAFWCFGQPLLSSIKVNNEHNMLVDVDDYDATADAMIESRVTVHPVSQEIAVTMHRVKDAHMNAMDEHDEPWSNNFDD